MIFCLSFVCLLFVFGARTFLSGSNLTDVGEVAAHYQTLGDTGIDVTAVESEWWRLRHTSLESTGNTPCPILG